MTRMTLRVCGLVWTCAWMAILISCSATDGGNSRSGRGESCRFRNDCESGLRCIGAICVERDFPITVSAKSCDRIECTTDDDCCGEETESCRLLAADCEAGLAAACIAFEDRCVCRRVCTGENRCIFQCASDGDCRGINESCIEGQCVQCQSDADCPSSLVCVDSACVAECTSVRDCPYFHTCTDRRCVETGCTTDRECIAYANSPRAACVMNECSIPCQSDADCNTQARYSFNECVDGQCVYAGCETDEECRIFLDIEPGLDQSVVCRAPL